MTGHHRLAPPTLQRAARTLRRTAAGARAAGTAGGLAALPATSTAGGTPRRRQRGLYAIEFALVFLVFFAVLYAVICYGILFSVRAGMQNAAEEGARAGLRYQTSWELRLREAEREAGRRLTWMKYPPTATAQLCQIAPASPCSSGAGAVTPAQCAVALDQLCQIVVTITYAPYGNSAQPWLPPLPGPLLPGGSAAGGGFTLVGRAGLLIDGKVL